MSDQRPLRALEQLGAELDRAVRADHDPTARRRPWRRTGLLATVLVLFSTGVAIAAGFVLGTDDPIRPPAAIDLGPEIRPVAGSGRLSGSPSPDPAGAPPWDVRVSRTATGLTCTAVGQTYEDRFGIVGLDRRFRELPLGVADACGATPTGSRVQVGARPVVGSGDDGARTIVAGAAGPDVRRVTVAAAGGPAVETPIGRNRGFVRALPGYVENARPVVTVTAADGTSHTIGLADVGKDVAPDPEGGAPWQVEIEPRRGCAQAQRVRASQSPNGTHGEFSRFTDEVCADRATGTAIAMRRTRPLPFQAEASRTIVWGRAGREVVSLELRVPGQPARPLPIGRHGRSILAVLDGRTDPRRVVLRMRTRAGRTLEQRGSSALRDRRGRRIREPAAAPYVPAIARRPGGRGAGSAIARPVPETIRTTPAIRDPTGGPPWALRTFVSRPKSALRVDGRVYRRLSCFAVARIARGAARRPTADGNGAPLPLDDTTAGCVQPVRDARPGADVFAYATGTTRYAPRIGRIVVSGIAPEATRLQLTGARGGPRRLAIEAGGAFLAVLAPQDVTGPLRVRASYPDGTTARTRELPTGRGRPARVAVRTADPDGAAPWALTAKVTKRQRCTEMGQLIDGALATIDPQTGSVVPRPAGSTCFFGRMSAPVVFNRRDVPNRTRTPTTAQIQRRTLGGRTLLYGLARSDIDALTITTPRDVRTVRPTGPTRAFLIVLDGTLTSGTIDITPYRSTAALKTIRIPILG